MNARTAHVWLLSALLVLSLGCNRYGLSNRADADIANDVQGRINADSNLPNKQITINASNGTVTLSGFVGNETERMAAANDAAGVSGVKTVVNNLQVNPTTADNFPTNQNVGPSSSSRSTSTRGKRSGKAGVSGTPGTMANSAGSSYGNTASALAAPVIPTVRVPSGTNLSVFLNDGITTEKAQPGDHFSGMLGDAVYVNEKVAIPRNAEVEGRVVQSESAGKFKGRSVLVLELTSIAFNGHSYHVTSDRWSKEGSSRGKNTAAKVGGGAAVGAIIGGIAGGGKGAAIGAAAGAGAGTGVQAITHGEQVVLKPESMVTFNLEAPVTVTPSETNNTANRNRLDTPRSDPPNQ